MVEGYCSAPGNPTANIMQSSDGPGVKARKRLIDSTWHCFAVASYTCLSGFRVQLFCVQVSALGFRAYSMELDFSRCFFACKGRGWRPCRCELTAKCTTV